MANILPFLKMTAVQAANFREQTATAQNRLDPRLVDAGPHTNSYVLPKRVMYDPAHADKLMALTMLTEIALDIDTAWPPPQE